MRYMRGSRFLLSPRAYLLVACALFLLLSAARSFAGTNYVDASSATPVPPYVSWQTAATNIQDAIDAAGDGDTVLVTNGVYDTGGIVGHDNVMSRIAITNAVTVRSVDGPESTSIEGTARMPPMRCAYVGDKARLEGFTLTNGYGYNPDDDTSGGGGGVRCASMGMVSNCVITENQAFEGGGTYGGTIQNCTITGNSAHFRGGGAVGSTLQNCTISGNSAVYGGGTYVGTIQNCMISGNTANSSGGGAVAGTLQNCTISGNSAVYGGGTYGGTIQNCTITGNSADRGGGTYLGVLQTCIVYYNSAAVEGDNFSGGIVGHSCTTPDPGGIGSITADPQFMDAEAGDYRLHSISPCIDAGDNQDWMNGAVDLDGLPRIINGTVDMGAYESPSAMILSVTPLPSADEVVITWPSFSNAHYAVRGSTNPPDGFELIVQDHIPAAPPLNVYTDTVNGATFRCYRVESEP